MRSRRFTPGAGPGNQPGLAFFHGQPLMVELLEKGFFGGCQVEGLAGKGCARTRTVAAQICDFRFTQAARSMYLGFSAECLPQHKTAFRSLRSCWVRLVLE